MMIFRPRASLTLPLLFCLTACAGAEQNLNQFGSDVGGLFGDEYLANKQDVCYRQRESLAEQGQLFDPELVQATLLGAGAGALTALVSGQNVVAGAAIGGGLGLATGYFSKLQSEGYNGTQIASSARTDIQTTNQNIDRLLLAFDSLSTCRKEEALAVQRRFNAKTTTREEAEAEMAGVRARYREDRLKFEEVAKQISESSDGYVAIYNEIAADNQSGALEVQEYKPGKRSAKVKRKPPQKQAGTEAGSLKAEKTEVDALQRDCLTNVKKRDDCFERVAAAEQEEQEFELG